MSTENLRDVLMVVQTVEEETGYTCSVKEISDLLGVTRRKCRLKKLDADYFLLQWESDLRDYVFGQAVNEITKGVKGERHYHSESTRAVV